MADDKKTPPTPPEKVPDPNEGPGKGKAFFDRAKTVAGTGNYDYAIEMYIEGLFRETFQCPRTHRPGAKSPSSRKLQGEAKPCRRPSGGQETPLQGQELPKEALLNNEFLLAKDFGNITAMLAIIRNAVLLELKDLVMWLGPILQQANATTKTPKLETFMELADIYESIGEFSKASEALQGAINLRPNDMGLIAKAKDLSALAKRSKKGNYEGARFFPRFPSKTRKAPKNSTKKRIWENPKNTSSGQLKPPRPITKRTPWSFQVIAKYSKRGWPTWNARNMRTRRSTCSPKALPKRTSTASRWARAISASASFDATVPPRPTRSNPTPAIRNSCTNTKNSIKNASPMNSPNSRNVPSTCPPTWSSNINLACAHWETKNYDQAIVALQEGQNNPKHRVDALHLLGRAFLIQHMTPEAVETLKRSIDEYDLAATGDKKAKELYYYYALALEQNGNAEEAIVMFSKIVQWEMGYKDARKHLIELRAKLGGGGSTHGIAPCNRL